MSRRREQVSLFAAFHAAGVEYAVVGGVAVNAHGFVRNTRDLDVFIRPTEENAEAAFRALAALGAPLEGIDHTDLLTDDAHYQLDTEHGRVDVLSSIGDDLACGVVCDLYRGAGCLHAGQELRRSPLIDRELSSRRRQAQHAAYHLCSNAGWW